MSECSKHDLEVIKSELEYFFTTKLYQTYLSVCLTTKTNLFDDVLGASLRGVESLFTREALLGESNAWNRMPQLFLELLEDLNNEIKKK